MQGGGSAVAAQETTESCVRSVLLNDDNEGGDTGRGGSTRPLREPKTRPVTSTTRLFARSERKADSQAGEGGGGGGNDAEEGFVASVRRKRRIRIEQAKMKGAMTKWTEKDHTVHHEFASDQQEGQTLFVPGSSYVLDPRSKPMLIWIFIISLFVIWTSAIVPVQIAWFSHDGAYKHGFFFVCEIMITVVFTIDLICQFNLAFFDRSNIFICERWQIAFTYLSGWFLMDLAATIPFAYVYGADYAALLRLLKVLRLTRFGKVLGSPRLMKYIECNRPVDYDSVHLIKFFLALMLLMHVMGCGLFIVANINNSYATEAEGGTTTMELDYQPDNFYAANNLYHLNIAEQWLYGIYWAAMTLTTIGYGDVSLVTTAERAYAIGCMLIGASVYAYMVGSVINVVLKMGKEEADRQTVLSTLNYLMGQYQIQASAQRKVRMYFSSTSAAIGDDLGSYELLLSRLSPELRATLLSEVHKDWLGDVWWMWSKVDRFTAELLVLFRKQSFCRDEHLFRAADPANWLYVVRGGSVDVAGNLQPKNKCVLGTEIILKRAGLYGYSVITTTFCDSICLSKAGLWRVLDSYPKQRGKVRMAEMLLYIKRRGGVSAVKSAHASWTERQKQGRGFSGEDLRSGHEGAVHHDHCQDKCRCSSTSEDHTCIDQRRDGEKRIPTSLPVAEPSHLSPSAGVGLAVRPGVGPGLRAEGVGGGGSGGDGEHGSVEAAEREDRLQQHLDARLDEIFTFVKGEAEILRKVLAVVCEASVLRSS